MDEVVSMNDMLAKRIRRNEVANLELAAEVSEIRLAQRSLYEAIIALAKRIPPNANIGADPIELLMAPPWHKDASTGNVLPPPEGLDLDMRGLAAFRMRMDQLADDQLREVLRRQERSRKLLETLLLREKERAARLRKEPKSLGPEIGG